MFKQWDGNSIICAASELDKDEIEIWLKNKAWIRNI